MIKLNIPIELVSARSDLAVEFRVNGTHGPNTWETMNVKVPLEALPLIRGLHELNLELSIGSPEPDIDRMRLDWLSDPANALHYYLTPKKTVVVQQPFTGNFDSFIEAIDYARCHAGIHPFCIKCKNPLNELHRRSNGTYKCHKCNTAFEP